MSEFNHKLLEWLQEAFALQQVEGQSESSEAEGSETEKEEENPVVKLFYGKCRTEGVNEGVLNLIFVFSFMSVCCKGFFNALVSTIIVLQATGLPMSLHLHHFLFKSVAIMTFTLV